MQFGNRHKVGVHIIGIENSIEQLAIVLTATKLSVDQYELSGTSTPVQLPFPVQITAGELYLDGCWTDYVQTVADRITRKYTPFRRLGYNSVYEVTGKVATLMLIHSKNLYKVHPSYSKVDTDKCIKIVVDKLEELQKLTKRKISPRQLTLLQKLNSGVRNIFRHNSLNTTPVEDHIGLRILDEKNRIKSKRKVKTNVSANISQSTDTTVETVDSTTGSNVSSTDSSTSSYATTESGSNSTATSNSSNDSGGSSSNQGSQTTTV